MGIVDKDEMVAARNAQTEKNTSHSRRNKNFHAERYLSLFLILLLLLDPRRRDSVFTGFHGTFCRQFSPATLPFPLPSPMSSLSHPDITLARLSTIFLSLLQFYLRSPIGCGTHSHNMADKQSAVRVSLHLAHFRHSSEYRRACISSRI